MSFLSITYSKKRFSIELLYLLKLLNCELGVDFWTGYVFLHDPFVDYETLSLKVLFPTILRDHM